MKKRTLALALMLMAFSMTACGKTQIEDTVAETASDTASGVVSDTVTSVDVSETIKDETQTETEAETTAETKADISLPSLVKPEAEETTTASESVTETEKESASEKVASKSGYTMTIDSAKWQDFNAFISEISEMVEDSQYSYGLTAEQIEDMYTDIYVYVPDPRVNFNVVSTDMGMDLADISMKMYGELLIMQYKNTEGITYHSHEVREMNGKECLKISVSAKNENNESKMAQYLFIHGTKQFVFTCTASSDAYDEGITEFEKILNTVEFT